MVFTDKDITEFRSEEFDREKENLEYIAELKRRIIYKEQELTEERNKVLKYTDEIGILNLELRDKDIRIFWWKFISGLLCFISIMVTNLYVLSTIG